MLKSKRHRNTAPTYHDPPAWFSSEEAILADPDLWYLYVIFTEAPDGMGLLKVGVTQDPAKRVRAIRQGSPLPLKAAIFTPAGNRKLAHTIESSIHTVFRDRKTRGEWFRFDYSDAIDKRCFHQGTKGIYAAFTKRHLSWMRIPDHALSDA